MRFASLLLLLAIAASCSVIRPDWQAVSLPLDDAARDELAELSSGTLLGHVDGSLAGYGQDPPSFWDDLGGYFEDRFLDLVDIGHLDLSIGDGVYLGAHATYLVSPDIGVSRGFHAGWDGRQVGLWQSEISGKWLREQGWLGAGPPDIQRRPLAGSVLPTPYFEAYTEETGLQTFASGGDPWEVGAQVRFILGVGVDVRLGETVDFLLGWFGVDTPLGAEHVNAWLASKRAIGELARRGELGALMAVVDHAPSDWQRLQALSALRDLEGRAVAETILGRLESSDEQDPVEARLLIEALGRVGGEEDIERVDALFSLEAPQSPLQAYQRVLVNSAVAFALARLGAEGELLRARLGWSMANFPERAEDLGRLLGETANDAVRSVVVGLPLELKLEAKAGLRDVPRPYLQALYSAQPEAPPEGGTEAVRALRLAVEVDPADGSTWLALALVEASLGDGVAAIDALQQAAELGKFFRGTDPRVRFLYALPEPHQTEVRDLIFLPKVGDGEE
ncbi:MAG: hypothetical protein RL885_29310 [Planctomycetota bacterium]